MNPEYNRPPEGRTSPTVLACIGDYAVTLTYWNTLIVAHRTEPAMNHVRITDGIQLPYGGRVFGRTELQQELVARHYPYMWRMYPTDTDIQWFNQWRESGDAYS